MSETLSEQDKADLASIGVTLEDATPRSLLETWRELLKSIDVSAAKPIPIHVAAKVVASWPQMTFQDTAVYHERYHEVLAQGRDLLTALLVDHPEALGWTGEDDAVENHDRYIELLVGWHMIVDGLEENWVASDHDSHIWVAVIADARAYFFSRMGLAGHLDAIGVTITNDEFDVALAAAKEG